VRILVLNPGSSTLKAAVLDPAVRTPVAAAEVPFGPDASRGADAPAAVEEAVRALNSSGVDARAVEAVGYRVVHGGTRFRGPVVIDDLVLAGIVELAELAPLHNPVAAATIRAGRTVVPAALHVACFDTAFHGTLPEDAIRYAVPERWTRDWGVRRYGFHGLSVEWSVRRAAELLRRPSADLGLVVAHLGSGCSVTAVDRGRPLDTSMGMTPLEGLVMGTRAGSLDPGILLALLRDRRLTAAELAEELDHRSGLVGLAGTSDVRVLLAAEANGDEVAALALAVFVRRAAAGIAAAATSLQRLDAIVFTGGIGEHAHEIRTRILGRLGALGVDPTRPGGSEGDWATERARGPAVVVVAAREDIVIAEAAARLVQQAEATKTD
jgi:acetate kinase